jgi:hypothetical protein
MRDHGAALLSDIQSIFALDEAQLASLFGVDSETIAQWRTQDIPVDRRVAVQDVHELAQLYARKFRPERIGDIVRTPARGLGGKSVLDVIATSGTEPVFHHLHELFSYQST